MTSTQVRITNQKYMQSWRNMKHKLFFKLEPKSPTMLKIQSEDTDIPVKLTCSMWYWQFEGIYSSSIVNIAGTIPPLMLRRHRLLYVARNEAIVCRGFHAATRCNWIYFSTRYACVGAHICNTVHWVMSLWTADNSAMTSRSGFDNKSLESCFQVTALSVRHNIG